MELGKKISLSRKERGVKAFELASAIGRSTAVMSDIENDRLKGGPSPDIVVKISEELKDSSILTCYLENNPVYQSIIPKIFPDLNNIRKEPAIIFGRFVAEAREAIGAAEILQEIFSNADPTRYPEFEKTLHNKLEQIVDVQRCSEVLFLQLIAAGVITEEERGAIHHQQQQKCIERGHHVPEQKEAV